MTTPPSSPPPSSPPPSSPPPAGPRLLAQLAALSLREPRAGAREVMRLAEVRLDRAARWQALLLVVVLSAVVGELAEILAPAAGAGAMRLFQSPITVAALQMGLLVVSIHAVFWIGRAAGGNGSFHDSLLLMTWMQAILLAVQVVQVLALVLVPPLAGMIGIAGLALSLWLMTGFVAELHGFASMGRVFLGIVAATFALAFATSILLMAIGVFPRV